jgi:hypothetical protein
MAKVTTRAMKMNKVHKTVVVMKRARRQIPSMPLVKRPLLLVQLVFLSSPRHSICFFS